jgi:hypothetical protein
MTLYLVSTSAAVVHWGLHFCVDTHCSRGLSYFQIGWRWIQLALIKGEHLVPRFWLEPDPDPYPVYASKRQAISPVTALFDLRLEIS